MTQQLFIGDECVSKVRDLFHENRWNRILLVTGKLSYETSGAESFVRECLSGIDTESVRFCDFASNPNITDLNKGLALTREFNTSAIIAIGGGSVLDMGKLLRFFLTHGGDMLNGPYIPNGKDIPLIAIPTTAGTGAEATHFAVLYDEQGKKHSIADISILPDCAVVYPPLTYGQSPYVTACSGFDALAQAIEAYWNKNATKESDRYAEKAMELIYPSLPDAVNHPTKEVRDMMAEGAYWAGRAINITKTTAPHAFSYPFTSLYGIPHGHAVSMVFPKIADLNLSKGDIREEKERYLVNILNINNNTEESLSRYIVSLGLAIPSNDYDIEKIIDGISLERLANNPISISKTETEYLLSEIILHSGRTNGKKSHFDY